MCSDSRCSGTHPIGIWLIPAFKRGFIHMPLRSKSVRIKKNLNEWMRVRDTQSVVWIQPPSSWHVWSCTDSAFSSLSCYLGGSSCFSYHFALFIYVPIRWIASFTFNFIDILGLRGLGKSRFKACLTWLRLNIWKKCDLFRSRQKAMRVLKRDEWKFFQCATSTISWAASNEAFTSERLHQILELNLIFML